MTRRFALAALLAAAPARASWVIFTEHEGAELKRQAPPLSGAESGVLRSVASGDPAAIREHCDPPRARRHALLRFTCGLWLMSAGDELGAVSAHGDAARLLPESAVARRMHAWALLNALKIPEAEREARAAVRLSPQDSFAHWLLGRALIQLKRFPEALSEIEIAERLNPTFPPIDLDMGLALEALKRPEDARTRLILFTRLSKKPETDPDMLRARAALQRLGAAAAGENPASFSAEAGEDADAAMAELRLKRYDEAERLARRAAAAAPRYWRAHHVLAFVRYRRAGAPAALPHARRAVALEPSNASAQLRLAELLRENGRLEEAVRHSVLTTTLAPLDPAGYHELAHSHYGLGNMELALAAVKRALEVRPDYAHSLNLYGHLLNESGRPQEALPVLERALYADPRNPMPNFNLGLAYAATGKRAEAEYHLKTYLSMTKDDPDDAWRADARKALAELARPARKNPR